MKIISNSGDFSTDFYNSMDMYDEYYWAVAWATLGEHSKKLKDNVAKIKAIYISNSKESQDFMREFIRTKNIYFISGKENCPIPIHSKHYMFKKQEGDKCKWCCYIGSANYTTAGFGNNYEIMLKITDSDDIQGDFLSDSDKFFTYLQTKFIKSERKLLLPIIGENKIPQRMTLVFTGAGYQQLWNTLCKRYDEYFFLTYNTSISLNKSKIRLLVTQCIDECDEDPNRTDNVNDLLNWYKEKECGDSFFWIHAKNNVKEEFAQKSKFHPKFYFFRMSDSSSWALLISSHNLTSDKEMIQSSVFITDKNDDLDKTLLTKIYDILRKEWVKQVYLSNTQKVNNEDRFNNWQLSFLQPRTYESKSESYITDTYVGVENNVNETQHVRAINQPYPENRLPYDYYHTTGGVADKAIGRFVYSTWNIYESISKSIIDANIRQRMEKCADSFEAIAKYSINTLKKDINCDIKEEMDVISSILIPLSDEDCVTNAPKYEQMNSYSYQASLLEKDFDKIDSNRRSNQLLLWDTLTTVFFGEKIDE